MSAELTKERMQWMGKVLRQIGQIRPGMKRKDLLMVYTTEGGVSTRTQRTYVYKECPYIKVTVHFKALEGESSALDEDLDDIIESFHNPSSQGSWWTDLQGASSQNEVGIVHLRLPEKRGEK